MYQRVPSRIGTQSLKDAFRKRAGKFFVESDTNKMKFKKSDTVLLRFFTEEEEEFKNDYIEKIHDKLFHARQDPMYEYIKNEVYGITKECIVKTISKCQVCLVKNKINDSPNYKPYNS